LVLFDNPDCELNEENLNPTIINNPDPETDNCPQIPNTKQENKDNDIFGDICDKQPNTPNTSSNPDADSDNDGVPNNQDPDNTDSDNDGVPNYIDNLSDVPISNNIPTTILQ
jgi:Thrombospondin type 3 repeat